MPIPIFRRGFVGDFRYLIDAPEAWVPLKPRAQIMNRHHGGTAWWMVAAIVLGVLAPALAHAQPTTGGANPSGREELARNARNPLAVRISLAFQNNANFDLGPQ